MLNKEKIYKSFIFKIRVKFDFMINHDSLKQKSKKLQNP